MRLEHQTIRYRQPGLHKEGGEEQSFDLQRPGCPGKGDMWVLPILLLRINKSPDLKQPHPDAPAPHFGLRDEGLLVCDPQLRSHVEALLLPMDSPFWSQSQWAPKRNEYGYIPIFHTHSPVITTDDI